MLYVVFEIGTDGFLLRATDVVRLAAYRRPRPVPAAPPGLAGLLTFDGTTVPAIDPGVAIMGKPSMHLRSTRIAFCRHGAGSPVQVVGIVLESAVETVRLTNSEFSPPPISMERCRCAGDLASAGGRLVQRIEAAELATEEVWDLVARAGSACPEAAP